MKKISQYAHNQHYSNEKSVKELSIHYSPVEEGIIEAVDYFSKKNS